MSSAASAYTASSVTLYHPTPSQIDPEDSRSPLQNLQHGYAKTKLDVAKLGSSTGQKFKKGYTKTATELARAASAVTTAMGGVITPGSSATVEAIMQVG